MKLENCISYIEFISLSTMIQKDIIGTIPLCYCCHQTFISQSEQKIRNRMKYIIRQKDKSFRYWLVDFTI